MTQYNTTPTADMQRVLERIAAEDAGKTDPMDMPPAEGRAAVERNNTRWNRNKPEMARVEPIDLGLAAPGTVLMPAEDEGRGAILYIHGGGWAFCSAATHDRFARVLAIEARAPVVTFDYRLAPEHPFPAGLEDCVTAWGAFAKAFSGRALGIGGDSAGANLALAAMLKGLDPRPDAGLLFYGAFAADYEAPSYTTFADGPQLTLAKMKIYYDWYVSPADRAQPLVAPLQATDAALSRLPPLFLNAAGLDPLRSDAEALSARLKGLGRDDPFVVHEGVVHGFLQMTEVLPEAREASRIAGDAFRKLTA